MICFMWATKENLEKLDNLVKNTNLNIEQIGKELGFENDRMQVGVSAQEIEKVLPELIKDAPIGRGYKTIDYGKITPLLIETIKELKTEINQLKGIV